MSLQTIERNSPSPQESESEDQCSLSSYEGFVCREGCAISLSPRPGASVGKHGDSLRIMTHLKKVIKLMRKQDSIRLAVELERCSPRNITRYMILITTQGVQDTEETVVLGTEQRQDGVTICLVLPLWRDTEIKLDGDGGFSVHTGDKHHVFKPCSVQSMWTALQSIFKAIDQAILNNYYVGGLSHTWMTYYKAQLTDDGVSINEWNIITDLESFRPDSPVYYDSVGTDITQLTTEKENFRKLLVVKLREVMLHCDLEEVTSRQLRLQLEEEMRLDLREYKGFLDQQMLIILGQLERPSRIHEYLYLGSEWNAADLTALQEIGIGYILNVTREIDNFYPEVFMYKCIRLYDVPESELLKHWDDTYKFIKEAKENNSKVLVHCKMGISRSAATVIAFTMKEYRMSLEEAFKHVKSCRNCINPNHGFMDQLHAYEGILKARYNDLFGYLAPSRLSYSSRSNSESNICKKSWHSPNNEMEDGGYLPNSDDEGEEDEDGRLKMRSGSESCLSQMEEALENQISMSLPPEKVPGMMNYLVSLPMPEEDLGIIVPSPSESGSSFSSPLLTPPDDEGIQHLVRGFQESERKKLQLSEKVDEVKKDEMKSVEGIKVTGYVDQSPDDGHPLATLTPSSPTHMKVARVTSLPTASLLPSVSVPVEVTSTKSQSVNGDSFKESDDVDDLMNPDEEVKTTLIQSVTYRIKEIEKMNNKSTLERPGSAGSQKHISMGSFSVASSEESLHSRPSHPVTSDGDDNGSSSQDKRSSLSPVKGDVTMETILPNIIIQSHSEESLPTIPSNEKTETESVQRNWTEECKTPSPSPNIVPDSPNTVYRKATQASILLAEQKKNQLKFGVMGDNDNENKPIFSRQGLISLTPIEDKIDTSPDDGISSTKSIKNSDTQSSEDTSLLNDKHIEKQDIENKPLSPSHNIVPDSPNTVYKKATQTAILLTEQKQKAKLEVAGNNDIDEKSASLRQPFTFTPLSNIEDSLPNKISSAVNKINEEVQDSAVVYSSINHLSRDVSHDKKVDMHTVITQSIKTPSPPNTVPDSPNTVYRKATQASILLAEKKNQQVFEVTVTHEMTLSSGDVPSVSGKGVKELTGLFRDEVSGGSVIKRSHSLRERPHSGENLFIQTHKRSSSANTTEDTDPTTELHESHD